MGTYSKINDIDAINISKTNSMLSLAVGKINSINTGNFLFLRTLSENTNFSMYTFKSTSAINMFSVFDNEIKNTISYAQGQIPANWCINNWDFSQFTGTKSIFFTGTDLTLITQITLSQRTNANYINIKPFVNLTSLNLKGNSSSVNYITELDVSNNILLESLNVGNNPIDRLSKVTGLSNLSNLTLLDLQGLNLYDLDGLEALNLTTFLFPSRVYNGITFDLSNSNLEQVSCSTKGLTILDVSSQTNCWNLIIYNATSLETITGLANLVNLTHFTTGRNRFFIEDYSIFPLLKSVQFSFQNALNSRIFDFVSNSNLEVIEFNSTIVNSLTNYSKPSLLSFKFQSLNYSGVNLDFSQSVNCKVFYFKWSTLVQSVDDLLIHFDTFVTGSTTIALQSLNTTRTSLSDVAYNNLLSRGNIIIL
jgi:hypothetical protein